MAVFSSKYISYSIYLSIYSSICPNPENEDALKVHCESRCYSNSNTVIIILRETISLSWLYLFIYIILPGSYWVHTHKFDIKWMQIETNSKIGKVIFMGK